MRRAASLLALHAARQARALSARPRRQHFINLTNGCEALQHLGPAAADAQFVRIQSSKCEANDFYGLLADLDHNLLFRLATGSECVVYDYGSRGTAWPGESDTTRVPRAIWWGLEWTRYALQRTWKVEVDPPSLRGYNVEPLFREKLGRLPKPVYKKLKYYRKFSPTAVRLVGAYGAGATALDGDDEAYARLVDEWLAADSRADDPIPPAFRAYSSADWVGVGRGACSKQP
mmetsp:Transcript_3142/g.9199  ORF Transcript_3142/g.9199 Transcript_3142/m.9199 type:complete len:231 (-) Transcript_3142:70-762(-)